MLKRIVGAIREVSTFNEEHYESWFFIVKVDRGFLVSTTSSGDVIDSKGVLYDADDVEEMIPFDSLDAALVEIETYTSWDDDDDIEEDW